MKEKAAIAVAAILAVAVMFFFNSRGGRPAQSKSRGAGQVSVLSPLEGTLFPADMRSPEFIWQAEAPRGLEWDIKVSFSGSTRTVAGTSTDTRWTPDEAVWDEIRKLSNGRQAVLEVSLKKDRPGFAPGRVGFMTSKDPVGAPLFYRAVPGGTSFPTPDQYSQVQWRLAWLSSYAPPVTVMRDQGHCFNCHASSPDGRTIGFEFNTDIADRASYFFIRDPGASVAITPEQTFSWNGYRPGTKSSPLQANGSAISPDGKVIATSGNGLTLLHTRCPDMIQYTFPIRGIILYRTLSDPQIRVLPGADDENFLYTPTSWSPDGKYIYFFGGPIPEPLLAMGKAKMDGTHKEDSRKLGWRELDKMYPFRYGLYRIPFNGGRGGRPEPLRGGHDNGMSNFFPRVSPDGKWIVFTGSDNGSMLVREDSDLYIMPAAGGEARKLGSNGPRADSWHSWSPNGRWLAFASKSHGDKTDIVLTHINEKGEDSPPVVLTHLRDGKGLSLNLPEFFNIKPGTLQEMLPRLPAAFGQQ
jgi:hypothetical protein